MKKRMYGSLTVGLLMVITVLMSSVVPSHAQSRGGGSGGGMHGGGSGGGWHGGQSGGGMHGGWSGGGAHGGWSGWHGGWSGWRGGWWGGGWYPFWGPGAFWGVGVGVPFWYPYGYAYPYPVYSEPVVVQSSPPAYVQQQPQPQYQPQYWYYCQSSQTYYPYVQECPSGWLQVVPQTSPPPQGEAPR